MGLGSKSRRNVYSATKAGLMGLCRASALDLGTDGITVNCIAPSLEAIAPNEAFDRITLGMPALANVDVGAVAAMLASEAAGSLTGETLRVDGGAWMNG